METMVSIVLSLTTTGNAGFVLSSKPLTQPLGIESWPCLRLRRRPLPVAPARFLRLYGLGFRVQGFRLRVQGFRLRVQGSGFYGFRALGS